MRRRTYGNNKLVVVDNSASEKNYTPITPGDKDMRNAVRIFINDKGGKDENKKEYNLINAAPEVDFYKINFNKPISIKFDKTALPYWNKVVGWKLNGETIKDKEHEIKFGGPEEGFGFELDLKKDNYWRKIINKEKQLTVTPVYDSSENIRKVTVTGAKTNPGVASLSVGWSYHTENKEDAIGGDIGVDINPGEIITFNTLLIDKNYRKFIITSQHSDYNISIKINDSPWPPTNSSDGDQQTEVPEPTTGGIDIMPGLVAALVKPGIITVAINLTQKPGPIAEKSASKSVNKPIDNK